MRGDFSARFQILNFVIIRAHMERSRPSRRVALSPLDAASACPLALLDEDSLLLIASLLGVHAPLAARTCKALRRACTDAGSGTSLAAVTTVSIAELWRAEAPNWRAMAPTILAALNDATDVLQWARDLGCAFSAKQALAAACSAGSLAVARQLLAEGCARVDAYNALEMAAHNGHATIVELLLSAMNPVGSGALTVSPSGPASSPVDMDVSPSATTACVSAGTASPTIIGGSVSSAMSTDGCSGADEAGAGTRVGGSDGGGSGNGDGGTGDLVAHDDGHEARGASAPQTDLLGDALNWSCEEGHATCARRLLDLGANVHAKHPFGNGHDALWFAGLHSHAEVVRLLLERGAKTEWPVQLNDPVLYVGERAA